MWAFEAYAEGLVVTTADGAESSSPAAPPRYLQKTTRNNDLFDASGKPLAASEMHDATTWRTHHAFGGRCALVKASTQGGSSTGERGRQPVEAALASSSSPCWAEQAWSAYQTWCIAFRLRSVTAEEPHILLSVAPAYYPLLTSPTGETREPDAATLASLPAAPSSEEQHHYNRRLLDTPLIWEEAYALSVECTPQGMFLWSDHYELFGKKIADRCLEVHQCKIGDSAEMPAEAPHPTAELPVQSYSAAVRLRFSTAGAAADTPLPALAVDLQKPSSFVHPASGAAKGADDALWQHIVDIPLPMDGVAMKASFRPHVTLLESGDSVEIL
jgi:hypothetical protein